MLEWANRGINLWTIEQGQITANTTLSAAITATATTINVTSAASLPSVGFINIDSETITYQNIVGNQLQYCFRAQNGTTAAAHNNAASVTSINLPNINVWPTGDGGGPYTFVYWRLRRMQRLQMLKAMYDEQWMLASDEDREKAPIRFVPRQSFNY
jgi:hypothetical protein